MKKRMISILLLICLLATSVGALTLTANAAGQVYYKIDFSSAVLKSGIGQRVSGDCAVVSMATVESYLYGATTQAEKNKIYDAVVSANGAKAYAYWAKVGYVSAGYGNFSLQKLYDELAQGYPVIVHRTGNYAPQHWSVVCGYTGSTSKLEESGFQVVDVYSDDTTYGAVRKMNLTQWKGKETLDNYARRKNGIAFTGFTGIRFAVNYPEIVHSTGNGHGVYGRVVSDTNLTSVNVAVVKAADGSAIYSKTVTPNAKSYSVYSLDSEMTFAKWSAGQYYYVITAKNASGTTKIFTKYFTIGSSYPSTAPTQPVYTFAYNANGGTGSMASSSVTYNQSVALAANAFTRDGYTFAGWNVQRSSDGLWHAAGQGWHTQAEITANGYVKSLYADKLSFLFNTSWIKSGGTGSCTYTFYAVWQKETHTHSYTPVVTAPTCTEEGYTTHVCSCGDSYVDSYVAALGHAWNGGVVTKQPTATENGIKTFTCTRCGATRTETIAATGVCDGGASCPSLKFIDVNPKQWYHLEVDFAVERGLFGGTSANTFEPETAMTRAMLVTVLWRYEGKPMGGSNAFIDVPSGQYYTDAVAWAAANGIVGGVGNGKFDPEGKITREQMATILFRYAAWKNIDTSKRGDLSSYPDAGKVSSWAQEAMRWTTAEGIINGSDGKLLPQGSATRAQVAAILSRFIRNLAEK